MAKRNVLSTKQHWLSVAKTIIIFVKIIYFAYFCKSVSSSKSMRDDVLFEINVYRCSLEKHKQQTLRVNNRYDNTVKNIDSILYSSGKIYTYHYNELIGVIVLQPFCSQIRGYLYLENAKRRRYGIRKKNFVPPMTKLIELSISKRWSSVQIYNELYEELLYVSKDIKKEYNGANVDLVAFVNIGQYVNWRELLIDKGVITDKK